MFFFSNEFDCVSTEENEFFGVFRCFNRFPQVVLGFSWVPPSCLERLLAAPIKKRWAKVSRSFLRVGPSLVVISLFSMRRQSKHSFSTRKHAASRVKKKS